jgi:predicted transcriptional regulator of viral defense system
MYMPRATSGAAGSGLHAAAKYMRGAAGIGLGETMKYLQRTRSAAANNRLSTTIIPPLWCSAF